MLKIYILLILLSVSFIDAQNLESVSPEKVGMDSKQLLQADDAINLAITQKEIPGAVLLVLKDNKIVYKKAYGSRQLIPQKLQMTSETIFDMASLTKPVVAATLLMILLEQGKLRMLDKVSHYFPGYIPWKDSLTGKKTDIRIIH